MFTAIDTETNETVFIGNSDVSTLKRKQLVDPIYYQEVYVRSGHKRDTFWVRPHFVSKAVHQLTDTPEDVIFDPEYIHKRQNTPYYVVGESEEHIKGKEEIAEWAFNNVYPELEGKKIVYEHRLYIPNKQKYRIIDVAILFPFGGVIALECQLSPISFEDFLERFYDYQSTGTDSYWFFGEKSYTKRIEYFHYRQNGIFPFYLDISYPSPSHNGN